MTNSSGLPASGHRGGQVVDCVDRSIGAIARNGELSSLNLNVLDMNRLPADFLLSLRLSRRTSWLKIRSHNYIAMLHSEILNRS